MSVKNWYNKDILQLLDPVVIHSGELISDALERRALRGLRAGIKRKGDKGSPCLKPFIMLNSSDGDN